MLFLYIFLFISSLVLLGIGADIFFKNAKELGVALKINPFLIGVVIIGFGTSLPEIAASFFAILQNDTSIVLSNIVGSNIANILLVTGMLVLIAGKKFKFDKSITKVELPLFIASTVYFLLALQDGFISKGEAFLLLSAFIVYIYYLLQHSSQEKYIQEIKFKVSNIVYTILGLLFLVIGAKYTISYAIDISTLLGFSASIISIFAIAIGTSLPEFFTSIKSVKKGDIDIAIGIIVGSSLFNILLVAGLSGIFSDIHSSPVVTDIGTNVLIIASIILSINLFTGKIERWEALTMLSIFAVFLLALILYV